MDVEIVAALDTIAGIGGRVYLINAPEIVNMPYCRFFKVIGVSNVCLSGVDGTQKHRYQFDLFGKDTQELKQLRDEFKTVLNASFSISEMSERSKPDQEQDVYHYILDVSIRD